jgi:hypothetical protein
MLQQFGDKISACLERDEECSEASAAAADDYVFRRQLLDLEQQWRDRGEE